MSCRDNNAEPVVIISFGSTWLMFEPGCLYSGSKSSQTTSTQWLGVLYRELTGEHINLLQSPCLTSSHAVGKGRKEVDKDAKVL